MSTNRKPVVAVVGLWHLGCTVAASLASQNYKIFGLDFEEDLIGQLKHAVLPISEPGLPELTKQGLESRNLEFSTDFSLLQECDYVVIAYDTPVDDHDMSDLSPINKTVGEIQKHAKTGVTVVVMSQVPAGTCRKLYTQLKKRLAKLELVYNPENVRLSQAIETYLHADRQIVGLSNPQAQDRMARFYSFYNSPLLFMSLESAELVKHAINSFLATSVSFINQIADLSEAVGGDVTDIVRGMKSDTRIGTKAFLSPGLGFAGGTLGRDLRALENLAKQNKLKLPLISDVYKINQERKLVLFSKLKRALKTLSGKKIALLGLVYKPGTNTLRRSLALEAAKWLTKQGAVVSGYDPALQTTSEAGKILKLEPSAYRAARGAHAVVVVTEWPEFKELDLRKLAAAMSGKALFDTKNILQPARAAGAGLNYYGTGIAKNQFI